LKSIFQTFEQQSKVKLNGNGLPQNGVVTAAAAFELLASEATAIPHIENLHNKMKIKGIWLWKKGAIEAHIGTTSKDERAWARFKRDVNLSGLQAICTEYQSVVDLVAWIRN
ncbi:MAG: ATP-dependent nuclease, partial [Halobacteriota archaeon]